MTLSLSSNIKVLETTDSEYVLLVPSLDSIKKDVYEINGYSDERLCLYDILYSLAEKVTITIEPIPSNAMIDLNMIE